MDLNGLAVDLGFLYMGVEKVDYHFCVESRSEIVDDTVLAVLLCFAVEFQGFAAEFQSFAVGFQSFAAGF